MNKKNTNKEIYTRNNVKAIFVNNYDITLLYDKYEFNIYSNENFIKALKEYIKHIVTTNIKIEIINPSIDNDEVLIRIIDENFVFEEYIDKNTGFVFEQFIFVEK